jgi:hypothetical protein
MVSADGNIDITFSSVMNDFWVNGAPSGSPVDNPYNTGIESSRACISLLDATASIAVVYESGDDIYGMLSMSFLGGFSEGTMIVSGSHPSIDSDRFGSTLHLVYYNEGSLWYALVDASDWSVSTNEEVISGVQAQRADIKVSDVTNKIIVVYNDGSGVTALVSVDGGYNWTT